jgi:hypothetical protein
LRVSQGRARQDKICLRFKFGGNAICYFCAVWLENKARLISCRQSAMALRPLAGFVQLSHFISLIYGKMDKSSPKMNKIRKKYRIQAFFSLN